MTWPNDLHLKHLGVTWHPYDDMAFVNRPQILTDITFDPIIQIEVNFISSEISRRVGHHGGIRIKFNILAKMRFSLTPSP